MGQLLSLSFRGGGQLLLSFRVGTWSTAVIEF